MHTVLRIPKTIMVLFLLTVACPPVEAEAMSEQRRDLQRLLFMNPAIGLEYDLVTEHCHVFNSGSAIRACNRVCHDAVPTDVQVSEILSFFGSLPCTWLVHEGDQETKELLLRHGLVYKVACPVMQISLDSLQEAVYADGLEINSIDMQTPQVATFASIVAHVFSTMPAHELLKVIAVLTERAPQACRLYLGYYQGQAVAASMVIIHQDAATLHWVCTMPAWRHKGFGFAMTHKPLWDAKQSGCIKAMLLATSAGQPLYERMGFTTYAQYDIYGS